MHQHRHDSRPARLMARADPGAIVPMEILVEEQMVAPVWVFLKRLLPAEDRSPPIRATTERRDQAVAQLIRDIVQRAKLPRPGRTLDSEFRAVKAVKAPQ